MDRKGGANRPQSGDAWIGNGPGPAPGSGVPYFFASIFKLMVAFLRESNELNVFVGLLDPW